MVSVSKGRLGSFFLAVALVIAAGGALAMLTGPSPPGGGVLTLFGDERSAAPQAPQGKTMNVANPCDLSTVKATRVQTKTEHGVHTHMLVDHMKSQDGTPVTAAGATLMRAPQWLPNRLGEYYMYFSGHNSRGIAIAYAPNITGPWTLTHHMVVSNDNSSCHSHVGSPDVHADHMRLKIILFFHCGGEEGLRVGYKALGGQPSLVQHSDDGLEFHEVNGPQLALADFYLRAFRYRGGVFGLCKHGNAPQAAFLVGSEASIDGKEPFALAGKLHLGSSRHVSVAIVGTTMYVFFSRLHSKPESILVSAVDISSLTLESTRLHLPMLKPHAGGQWANYVTPDNTGRLHQESDGAALLLLSPDLPYENGGQAPQVSKPGSGSGAQLRDPFVLMDADTEGVLDWHGFGGNTPNPPPDQGFGGWLVYNVQGEYSLAMARIEGLRALPRSCFTA